MEISPILDTILDGRTKGVPGNTAPFALRDIGSKGWNVLNQDLPLPLMVLKRSNLDYNSALFAAYLDKHTLSLAPHGKTTMCPQIFAEQLQHGAWGITAANVSQIQVMRHYGVNRIILANQLIGKANMEFVASELNKDPGFDFYCFVDSAGQLRNMAQTLAAFPLKRPMKILLEMGAAGSRTGMRSKSEALEVLELVLEEKDLFFFSGIAAFEGAIAGLEKSSEPVREFADLILDVAKSIPMHALKNMDEFILSGGGSAYFDIIADRFKTFQSSVPVRVVLRSGCYVTNDHGGYFKLQEEARNDPNRHWHQQFRPALEVWSYVQSMPEKGLAFLTMGKRDVPYDAGLPVPFKRYRPGEGFLDIGTAEIFATNDQHAYVRLPETNNWKVGDMIASGISHPCTAFDKWRFIPVVNDDYDVREGMLTFF